MLRVTVWFLMGDPGVMTREVYDFPDDVTVHVHYGDIGHIKAADIDHIFTRVQKITKVKMT
jgi:hypothetical protein